MIEDKTFSVTEVAEQLGVNEKTVYKYYRQGVLKGEQNPISHKWLGSREADIVLFKTGKSPDKVEVKQDNTGDSDAVIKAEEAARIAKANKETMTANAEEAKAKTARDAATLSMTVEEFRTAQENVLKLGEQYKAEELKQKEKDDERERERVVWIQENKTLGEQLEIKEANELILKEEVLRLRHLLGEKEEKEDQLENDKTNFKTNLKKAIKLLKTIASGIEDYSPDLKNTIEENLIILNSRVTYDKGMPVIINCHTAIASTASYFQDHKFTGFDGDIIAEWLYRGDEMLEKLMRIRFEDIPSDEPPTFKPPTSTGFGKILDNIAQLFSK